MSVTVHRRVSARRGSVAAPDPQGVHADVNFDPARSTSSTLTIIRVPQPLISPPTLPDPSRRGLHRRPQQPEQPNRVSFAFSSFGGGARSQSPDHRPSSPTSSPRLRPSSPHHHAGSGFASRPRLTPDQLVDLARESTKPHPHTPAPSALTPATFTPLPDDIYLPFIDRPTEVATLISSPPDVKLFTLLAQIFNNKVVPADDESPIVNLPRDPTRWTYQQLIHHLTQLDRDVAPDAIWAIAARKCILSHSELLWERIKGAFGIPPELDLDYDFILDDPRDAAAGRSRTTTGTTHRSESPDTDDISDDEGKGARGHWSDWDAEMESPIYTRFKRLSTGSSAAPSLYHAKRPESPVVSKGTDAATAGNTAVDRFAAQIEDRLHGLQLEGIESTTTGTSTTTVEGSAAGGGNVDTVVAPTPHGGTGVRSPADDSHAIMIGHFSPPLPPHDPIDGLNPEHISIEPILSPGPGATPFASTPLGDGLGDIAESAEDEEAAAESGGVELEVQGGEVTDGLVSPSQIQGIKISTSPCPAAGSFDTPPMGLSPAVSPHGHSSGLYGSTASLHQLLAQQQGGNSGSPASTSPASGDQGVLASAGGNSQPQPIPGRSRPHSRTSSFSSIGPFNRSESLGNLASSWSANAAGGSNKAWSEYGGSDYGGEGSVDGDARAAGVGPLFVSNFARLAGGPTLRANHPTVRSSVVVPQAKYGGRARKARAYSHGASSGGSGPSSPAVSGFGVVRSNSRKDMSSSLGG